VWDTQYLPYGTEQANANRTIKNSRIANTLIDEGFNRYYITSNGFGIQGGGILHKTIGVHELSLSGGGLSIGSNAVTIDAGGASTATFSVTADIAARIRVGDFVYAQTPPSPVYYIQRDGYNSNTDSQIINPFMGTISSIVGTTVTIKDIPYYIVTGTYIGMFAGWFNTYYGSMMGTVTSGSAVITNVYQENSGVNYVGKRLAANLAGIPNGAYIIAEDKGARTLTMSVNSTASIASAFLYTAGFGRDLVTSVAPASQTGWYFQIGDIISVSGSAVKYVCTATGIAGNGTHTPTFAIITQV